MQNRKLKLQSLKIVNGNIEASVYPTIAPLLLVDDITYYWEKMRFTYYGWLDYFANHVNNIDILHVLLHLL